MKRFKSLAVVLLALSLALALCACGDKPEEADTDAPEQNVTEPQDPGSEPAEDPGEQTQGAELEALKAQFIQDYQYSDYVDLDAARVTAVYALNADQVVGAAAFNASAGAAFPHEVVMIQACDEQAAKAIETSLYEHLDSIAMQAASYDPESEALAKASSVVTKGCYVGMFFTDHSADMSTAFQAAVS